MNALGYLRVSTDDQAENGHSLHDQAEKIRAYCVVKGWQLAGIVQDTGSGKNLKREGVAKVVQMAEGKQFDALIVASLDRLTRSVRDLCALLELCQQQNIALVSLNESIDTSTASGRFAVKLFGLVAEWERERIGERSKSVIRRLKTDGKCYCGPVIPKETAKRIGELRSDGLSWRVIASRLNREGGVGVRGGVWHGNTARRAFMRDSAR